MAPPQLLVSSGQITPLCPKVFTIWSWPVILLRVFGCPCSETLSPFTSGFGWNNTLYSMRTDVWDRSWKGPILLHGSVRKLLSNDASFKHETEEWRDQRDTLHFFSLSHVWLWGQMDISAEWPAMPFFTAYRKAMARVVACTCTLFHIFQYLTSPFPHSFWPGFTSCKESISAFFLASSSVFWGIQTNMVLKFNTSSFSC